MAGTNLTEALVVRLEGGFTIDVSDDWMHLRDPAGLLLASACADAWHAAGRTPVQELGFLIRLAEGWADGKVSA
jgi:hypothetical protein